MTTTTIVQLLLPTADTAIFAEPLHYYYYYHLCILLTAAKVPKITLGPLPSTSFHILSLHIFLPRRYRMRTIDRLY